MMYSTEPKFRKYIKRYGFLSFARKFSDAYGKKLKDAATKTRIDAAKTASKRLVQKTAEATAKTKSKEKEDERFWNHIKMEYCKNTDLLDTTSDNMPRIITKKWVEVHDQSGNAEDRYKPSRQIKFRTSMLRSDLCDFSDAYIVVKARVTANFNPRAIYVSNDFPINLFLFSIFPRRSSTLQITAARNAAIINAVNDANAADDRRNLIKRISFRNNAPFIKCISKINGTLINNAEDLDVAMPM